MAKVELAIIGLGFHAGEFNSVENFMKGLMMSKQAFHPGLKDNESYLSDKDELINKTVSEALEDSNLSMGERKDTAFILHCASSPEEKLFCIGGESALVSSNFNLGGPAYTIYDGENSIFRGLSLAEHLIMEKLASTIIVCMAPPIDGTQDKAEGSVVLILKEKTLALRNHNKIYAAISGLKIGEGMAAEGLQNEDFVAGELVHSLNIAAIGKDDLRTIEISGKGCSKYSQTINTVCRKRLENKLRKDNLFYSDTDSWFGSGTNISVAASFVKQALQLLFFHIFIYSPETAGAPGFFIERDPSMWINQGKRERLLLHLIQTTIRQADMSVLRC
ncbi:MAG: hypothetical protein FWC32_13425 [Firmicutes bacterium]|nr:hypothetical protein [Bacillota bacterium]